MTSKRRKASKYDGAPLRRFVELLATEPGIDERSAGLRVAKEQGASNPERFMEGLRRRHRVRRARGNLPPPDEQDAKRDAMVRQAMDELHASKLSTVEQAKADFARLKVTARQLGVEAFDEANLVQLQHLLDGRKSNLEVMTLLPPGETAGLFLERAKEPDAAYTEYREHRQQLRQICQTLEVVSELIRTVRILAATGNLPQRGED